MLARGNARQPIVRDEHDCRTFLSVLDRTVERHGLIVHAWSLMTNHYHLLVETPRAGLARAMQHLNGVYAQAFNRRHGRSGHLLQAATRPS